MLRYQKGYIFNGYTFVVNKEDVHNAPDDLFVKGTALLPDGWISVKERLPDKGQRVLTWSEHFGVCIAILRSYWTTDPLVLKVEPTHWQPLPPPPGEEDA